MNSNLHFVLVRIRKHYIIVTYWVRDEHLTLLSLNLTHEYALTHTCTIRDRMTVVFRRKQIDGDCGGIRVTKFDEWDTRVASAHGECDLYVLFLFLGNRNARK